MVLSIIFKIVFLALLWWVILPTFRRRRQVASLFVRIAVLLIASLSLEVFTSWQYQVFTVGHMIHHPSPVIWVNLAEYLAITLVCVAIFFAREWVHTERQQSLMKEVQLSTELNFLRSQIHPHFLFNTLNNLFSIAQRDGNEDMAAGISKLSGLMRYILYDSRVDKVSLVKEIEYMKDFIGLARLRFAEDEGVVEMSISGSPERKMIAPMILLPFIENAFKHGVLIEQPSKIIISISTADDAILFRCTNPIVGPRAKGTESGIGLENVKRRLILLYPGKHNLLIEDTTDQYIVNLTLLE